MNNLITPLRPSKPCQLTRFAVLGIPMILVLCAVPGNPAHARASVPVDINSLMQGHAAHLKVLKKIAKCFNSKGNRGAALRAIATGNANAASSLQNRCVSARDRAILQGPPNGAAMNAATRNKVLGATTPPKTYYKSMSWGLGPSAGAGFFKSQKGFTLDGGFIWNLNGHGSTRLYGSAGKAVDGFLALNIGADPIIISVYRSPVQSGRSVSYITTGSIEAGIGITGGAYTDSLRSNAEYQGFSFAIGVGLGFNAVSIYRVTSRVLRGRCPNVKIEAVNRTGSEIKVIDVDFHDYTKSKWRSEPTKNEKIANGRTYRKTAHLEKVDSENTQIRIKYRIKRAVGWSTKVYKDWSSKSVCHEGKTYTVSIENK